MLDQEKVDPRYLITPIWQLRIEFGWDWIKQQQEIFERILRQGE